MRILTFILCLFVILCSINVEARVYKCTDSKGKISYGPTPCKQDQMEKQMQEPYYNEAALQEEASIVAQREAQGRMIQNQIDSKNLRIQEEMELSDAIARNDLTKTAVLSKKIRDAERNETMKYIAEKNGPEMAHQYQIENELSDIKRRIDSLPHNR